MRLWHYELLHYLPKSQLIAQWRELNSIYKKQDKHILINYIYEFDKFDLMVYSNMVCKEMAERGYKINLDNYSNYFGELTNVAYNKSAYTPFKYYHNDRYLLQCFYNLQEKYDRGQKDFSEAQYSRLNFFVTEIKGLIK